jgi:hypothetical protein
MTGGPVEAVLAVLREEAATFRRRGLDEWAAFEESIIRDVEIAIRRQEDELLDLEQAARVSGYSMDRLRQLVRDGSIPDLRPVGSQGRIRVRRSDLPMKPRSGRPRATVTKP